MSQNPKLPIFFFFLKPSFVSYHSYENMHFYGAYKSVIKLYALQNGVMQRECDLLMENALIVSKKQIVIGSGPGFFIYHHSA